MSDRRTDIVALHQNVINAENSIIELSRRITEAIVAKRPTGSLSTELAEVTEARDFLRARLSRLEGEDYGGRQDQDRQA